MNYKDYQNARDSAWRIVIDMKIDALPVSTSAICRKLGIVVKEGDLPGDSDGQSTIINGTPFILVRSSCTPERKRFTVAHELGHILAGHVGAFELVNREPSPKDNPIEQAANVFASRLLAPACVLWGCGVQSAEDIQRLCCISRQAAEYRMKRMHVLYERDRFLTSPLERAVYRRFKKYIRQNRIDPR